MKKKKGKKIDREGYPTKQPKKKPFQASARFG